MTDSVHSANAETRSVQEHTPGPWRLCYDGFIEGASGAGVFALPFDSYKEFNDQPGHVKANQRLMAAAPELLSIAQRFLAHLECGAVETHPDDDISDAVRTAIAKATGSAT